MPIPLAQVPVPIVVDTAGYLVTFSGVYTANRVISLPNRDVTLNSATDLTGIVPVPSGGTGVASLAAGALEYGAGTAAHAALAIGTAAGAMLVVSTASVPKWGNVIDGIVSGALTIAKTGTTARTATFPDAAITVTGSSSALTSGRVPYATTGGLLIDSATGLLFNGTELSVAAAATAGNGLLQLASGTTKANGIAFGTDVFLYRSAANTLSTDGALAALGLNGADAITASHSYASYSYFSIRNSNAGANAGSGFAIGNDTAAKIGYFFANSGANTQYGGANSLSFGTVGVYNVAMLVNNTVRLWMYGASGGVRIGNTSSDPGANKLSIQEGIVLDDSANVVFGTSTGTKIGTGTTQMIGFWNAAPVVQPASASQAAVTTTGATNSIPYGYTTAAQADGVITLLNAIRTALVDTGIMKGAA